MTTARLAELIDAHAAALTLLARTYCAQPEDAVQAARSRLQAGEGSTECDDCGGIIPAKRRAALPGVRTCVSCQSIRDQSVVHSAINRRGSKDSQLR